MSESRYNPEELLIVLLSRQVRDGEVCACGANSMLPAAALLLMGMGVDNLSMSVACLPRVKWVIRNFTRAEAGEFVRDVLSMEEPRAIRRYMDTRLEKVGLGGLIRAGK